MASDYSAETWDYPKPPNTTTLFLNWDFPKAPNRNLATSCDKDFDKSADTPNFSKTVSNTFVVWDVEDSSILNDLDPFVIYVDIKSALAKNGYCVDNLLINAYIDEKYTLPENFTKHIYEPVTFSSQGNKYWRVHRMSTDFLCCALQYKNLVILSKNIGEDEQFSLVIEGLKKLGFNVVLQPLESLLGESLSGFGKIDNCRRIELETKLLQGAGSGGRRPGFCGPVIRLEGRGNRVDRA